MSVWLQVNFLIVERLVAVDVCSEMCAVQCEELCSVLEYFVYNINESHNKKSTAVNTVEWFANYTENELIYLQNFIAIFYVRFR